MSVSELKSRSKICKYVNYALSLLTPLQLVTLLQYVQISNKMKLARV